MTKKILYFDMDNVLVNFQSGIDRVDPLEVTKRNNKDLDEIPGIFSLMDPYPEAVDVFHEMKELFDTYILSTAPWNNPSAWFDKVEWVKKHLGNTKGEAPYKRLILSHNKHLNVGDFLIDDRDANGAGLFTGKLIHFGQSEFPDWESVRTYLLARVD